MAVKQMGSAPNENAYVCVRSGSLFFWLPMDQLLYITSSHMLRDAMVERKEPRDAPVALLDGRRIGGVGVYLVRKMVRSMEYRRENDRNVLTLHIDRGN